MDSLDGLFGDIGPIFGGEKEPEEKPEPIPEEKPKKKKKAKEEKPEQRPIQITHRMGHRNIARKLASEAALEAALPKWQFEEGDSFHCFSFGDVDSLTFFKMILRQQNIKYCALSTWCMAGEDVNDLRRWHRTGLIGRVDFYLGEIFKGSYPEVYDEVQDFIKEEGGRLCIFRNHSKVMAIKGERFDCLIESSANINTNPRSENTVITIDSGLVDEYIKLFGEIIPFNRTDYGAEPYRVEE